MLILISDAFDRTLPEILSRYGEVTDDQSRLADAEIVLVRSKTKVTAEYLDSAPRLRMVIRGGVGLDNIDQESAHKKGILVHNTAEASTTAVAELAFALMIDLASNVTKADRSMREGKWLKKELERTELSGKILGILGLGRIGLALAARARAFQMRVLGWHPDVYFTDVAEILPTMKEVLQRSDFVSLHVPLVPETRGMINKQTLSDLKDGAYLINTCRGKACIEEDVAAALKSGKLAGFATDVWYADPPENSPLFEAPNCIFTPHIGASTKENMLRIGVIIERLIADYVKTMKRPTV
ncbi:MAG TPA: NAD(P)-dependent oxidoreductase [Candidatus Deferrimicrobium sp.]|nr:NAD(P)-dependent oxidoreductase [Candidatus Deferrimicrobium sp.]